MISSFDQCADERERKMMGMIHYTTLKMDMEKQKGNEYSRFDDYLIISESTVNIVLAVIRETK